MTEPESKKRKANPVYVERKKRQKESVFTSVKTGVKKLCRDDGMCDLLQECVSKASLIACESLLLASFHVLRLLEDGQPLPEMGHTFFNQCVSSIANCLVEGPARSVIPNWCRVLLSTGSFILKAIIR